MGQNHIIANTKSQNHSTADRNPIRDQMLNTVGQNHGKDPWFCKFRVQIGIRDLKHEFTHAYATYPR